MRNRKNACAAPRLHRRFFAPKEQVRQKQILPGLHKERGKIKQTMSAHKRHKGTRSESDVFHGGIQGAAEEAVVVGQDLLPVSFRRIPELAYELPDAQL